MTAIGPFEIRHLAGVSEQKAAMSARQPPQRPDLAAELVRRADIDQQARGFVIRGDEPTEAEVEHLHRVDEDNTAWLEAVVNEHGWPGFCLVGEKGANAAWLLAQHADQRPELQRRWLPLLRAAVEAGDADPSVLAYLDDRVALADRRPQRHGTQRIGLDRDKVHLAPLEDPQRVNEYRQAVGLNPLTDDEINKAWSAYPTWSIKDH